MNLRVLEPLWQKTNKYKKFALSLVILLIIIVLSDQLIGRTLHHFYFKQQSGLQYRTTYAIDSTTADILVFGSSRANHHYVPELFEDSLQMSFYNTGRDGNFLLYNYAIFKTIVKRYTPKIVIFDINSNELYYSQDSYERLSTLLPYYKTHPEIRDIICLKSPFEKFKMISEIYPYNSSLLTIAIGNSQINKTRKADRKGYVPLYGLLEDTVLYNVGHYKGMLDSIKINSIAEIICYCRSNNIRAIFIQSPFYGIVGNSISTDYFINLAEENKIPFWNLINYPEFLGNPEYFKDQDHLNEKGAVLFSNLIVQQITNLN